MAQPDVRVDPAEVDAAGTALERVGADVAAAARTCGPAITPQPAWSPGFDSVAACAALADAGLDAVRRLATDLDVCAAALHACAAAWAASDDAVARSLRAG
ncbi:MAG: hypothetical protein ABW212_05830 [Pseudonocardia sediminis]